MTKVKKKILGLTIIFIGIVAVLLITISVLSKESKKAFIYAYDEEAGITYVYVNDKMIGKIEGRVKECERNMDDTAFYMTDTNDKIYYSNGKKIREVGEDVELVTISNNSKYALIMGKNGTLYRCDGNDLEKITDKDLEFATISGDGKTYAYYDGRDSYLGSKPGNEKEIDSLLITSISEDGKYIYGVNPSDGAEQNYFEMMQDYCFWSTYAFDLFLVDTDGNKEKIMEKLTTIYGLNVDGSEIMFSTEAGTYISVEGKKAIKVSDDNVYSIDYNGSENLLYGFFKPVDTLKDTICLFVNDEGDSHCSYLDKDYKEVKIVDGCSTILDLDDDLTKLIYINDEAEMKYAEIEKNAKEKTIAKDVMDGRMSDDGKHIYYIKIGENIDLHYVDSNFKDKEVKVFSSYSGMEIVGNDCYILSDENFCIKQDEVIEINSESGELFFDFIVDKAYLKEDKKLYSVIDGEIKDLKGEFKYLSSYDAAY